MWDEFGGLAGTQEILVQSGTGQSRFQWEMQVYMADQCSAWIYCY